MCEAASQYLATDIQCNVPGPQTCIQPQISQRPWNYVTGVIAHQYQWGAAPDITNLKRRSLILPKQW
jgi:hypothetical protein